MIVVAARDVGGGRRGAAVIGCRGGVAGADIVATGHVGRRGCGAVIVRRRGGLAVSVPPELLTAVAELLFVAVALAPLSGLVL